MVRGMPTSSALGRRRRRRWLMGRRWLLVRLLLLRVLLLIRLLVVRMLNFRYWIYV